MRGKLIVIEGADGSGKETQSKLLEAALHDMGIDALRISFPNYGSKYAIPVEQYLEGNLGDMDDISPLEVAMLFAFDRSGTWRSMKLQEKLDNGTWIICDRFTESNMIYQSSKLDVDDPDEWLRISNEIESLERDILGLPEPDKVIYLTVPRNISEKLINERGKKKDIHELNDPYLRRVSSCGLWFAKNKSWDIINCCPNGEMLSREEIFQDITTKIVFPETY